MEKGSVVPVSEGLGMGLCMFILSLALALEMSTAFGVVFALEGGEIVAGYPFSIPMPKPAPTPSSMPTSPSFPVLPPSPSPPPTLLNAAPHEGRTAPLNVGVALSCSCRALSCKTSSTSRSCTGVCTGVESAVLAELVLVLVEFTDEADVVDAALGPPEE
jgi:hypothetical protein